MNRYIQTVRSYVVQRKEIAIGAVAVLALIGVIIAIVLLVQSTGPKIVYQPAKACELFTPVMAEDLLGEKVIGVDTKDPVVSGDTATSKCSYTDENPDKDKMIVAAIAVRSGINDAGVAQNQADFATAQRSNAVEAVKDLGEGAYFNKTLGQLNVLDAHNWIILNYGIGPAPETNTVDKAVQLAHKILKR